MSTLFKRWRLFKLDDVITERNTCVARVEAAECPAGGEVSLSLKVSHPFLAPVEARPSPRPSTFRSDFSIFSPRLFTSYRAGGRPDGQSGDGAAFEAITICVHDESERTAASLIRRGQGGADPDRNSARSAHQLNKSRSRRLASPARSRSVHPFIQSFSSSRFLRRPSGTFALVGARHDQ